MPDAHNFPLSPVLRIGAASPGSCPILQTRELRLRKAEWLAKVLSAFGTLPSCLIPPTFLSVHHLRDENREAGQGRAEAQARPALLAALLACLAESAHLMGVSAGTPLSPISWV